MTRVCGPLERLDLGRGADLEDALAPDGERLRDGEAVVDGDDLAVDEHGVGRLCAARPAAAAMQQDKPSDAPERWSHVAIHHAMSRSLATIAICRRIDARAVVSPAPCRAS